LKRERTVGCACKLGCTCFVHGLRAYLSPFPEQSCKGFSSRPALRITSHVLRCLQVTHYCIPGQFNTAYPAAARVTHPHCHPHSCSTNACRRRTSTCRACPPSAAPPRRGTAHPCPCRAQAHACPCTKRYPEHFLHVPLPAFSCTSTPCFTCRYAQPVKQPMKQCVWLHAPLLYMAGAHTCSRCTRQDRSLEGSSPQQPL